MNDLQVNLLLALGLMHAGHMLEKKHIILSLHSGCHQSVVVLEDDLNNAAEDRFCSINDQGLGCGLPDFRFHFLKVDYFFGKLRQEMPQRQGSCRLHNGTTVKLHLIFATLLL